MVGGSTSFMRRRARRVVAHNLSRGPLDPLQQRHRPEDAALAAQPLRLPEREVVLLRPVLRLLLLRLLPAGGVSSNFAEFPFYAPPSKARRRGRDKMQLEKPPYSSSCISTTSSQSSNFTPTFLSTPACRNPQVSCTRIDPVFRLSPIRAMICLYPAFRHSSIRRSSSIRPSPCRKASDLT